MDKQAFVDLLIGSGALFQGEWTLERVGHEQWVFRGTEEQFPQIFAVAERNRPFPFVGGKYAVKITEDMKLLFHESGDDVQLRIYDKARIEMILGRDNRKLRVSKESIEHVRGWLRQAAQGGLTQLAYLDESMLVFGEE